jgi:hypothetical protein
MDKILALIIDHDTLAKIKDILDEEEEVLEEKCPCDGCGDSIDMEGHRVYYLVCGKTMCKACSEEHSDCKICCPEDSSSDEEEDEEKTCAR